MRARWLGPLVLGLSAALYPLAASAAPPIEAQEATVLEVSPSPDGVTVLLESIDPEQFADGVVASVDGRRVPASVERVSQRRPGSLVIVLETSSSMTGAIFGEARAIARGLIEAAPLGTPITLVTFDNEITVTRNQALDAVDLLSTLDELSPSGGAVLFDAVALVPKLIEPAPDPATVVLLTYGWDFGKVSSLDGEQAIATAAPVSGDYAAVVFGYTFDRQFFERLGRCNPRFGLDERDSARSHPTSIPQRQVGSTARGPAPLRRTPHAPDRKFIRRWRPCRRAGVRRQRRPGDTAGGA